MKSIFTILFLIIPFFTFGQGSIEITEKPITLKKLTFNALVVTIGNNPETVKKSFSRYAKEHLKVKMKKEGKRQIIADKGIIVPISDNTGVLRAVTLQEGKSVKLAVGFTMGHKLSLNSTDYPEETSKLKEFVRRYSLYHESSYFQEILGENQKRLKNLMKDLKASEKELNSLTKEIKKIDKTIKKEKEDNKRFDLSNKNIANRARVQAVYDIVANLRNEILKINGVVENAKGSLLKLEKQTYN